MHSLGKQNIAGSIPTGDTSPLGSRQEFSCGVKLHRIRRVELLGVFKIKLFYKLCLHQC